MVIGKLNTIFENLQSASLDLRLLRVNGTYNGIFQRTVVDFLKLIQGFCSLSRRRSEIILILYH